MSQDLEGKIRRIACVELQDVRDMYFGIEMDSVELNSSFMTMRFILEQAAARGIPVQKIALPMLGTGNQKLDLSYSSTALLTQCKMALQTIDSLNEIVFIDWDEDKAVYIAGVADRFFASARNSIMPKVFISYKSTQHLLAGNVKSYLESHGIPCWMAPESIPSGSNYLEEIPVALGGIEILLLLLTKEAEKSPWVSKEVGTAIASGKTIMPFQIEEFELSNKYRFLLEGIQVKPVWNLKEELIYDSIAKDVVDQMGIR